jgi:branched-chain amino acid aminotransferase
MRWPIMMTFACRAPTWSISGTMRADGVKAYRAVDETVTSFRRQNARRFNESAIRLAMPFLPEDIFLEAIERLAEIDRAWIPDGDGSLYLRPFMFASEAFLSGIG